MQRLVDHLGIEISHDSRRRFGPLGVKGLREAREGHMLGLDRSRPPAWWRHVDKASQAFRPHVEATNALCRPDHAEPNGLQLPDITNRAIEEEAIARIRKPLSITKLEQRLTQMRQTRLENARALPHRPLARPRSSLPLRIRRCRHRRSGHHRHPQRGRLRSGC